MMIILVGKTGVGKTGYDDDDDDGEKSINLKWWVDLSKVRDEYVIRTMTAICRCFFCLNSRYFAK